ncbi:hypothetical protein BpHYR1_004299 [Brachionus plicatilis]|uniref:Uncharacterized protein n=1 Tax=Brachionus plicatilis TaxID=10195 RepID=A0A3M7Q703_BRAPC|nr:hypothetical protein BpHYR1_004299 [Brachionus plicatilis]
MLLSNYFSFHCTCLSTKLTSSGFLSKLSSSLKPNIASSSSTLSKKRWYWFYIEQSQDLGFVLGVVGKGKYSQSGSETGSEKDLDEAEFNEEGEEVEDEEVDDDGEEALVDRVEDEDTTVYGQSLIGSSTTKADNLALSDSVYDAEDISNDTEEESSSLNKQKRSDLQIYLSNEDKINKLNTQMANLAYLLISKKYLITKFLDNIICYQVDNIIGGEDFDNIFCYQLITLSTRPKNLKIKKIVGFGLKVLNTSFRLQIKEFKVKFKVKTLSPDESIKLIKCPIWHYIK